jgi:type II secretory pathway predicted ATPase ExeA
MYEAFYGLNEKPFSITPDPKFFFQSDSHRGALDVLRLGVRHKDGFMVVTGDIGTGKTTLCRALLESLDDRVFSALILNPFLSEDDLLKVILQDFGVVSREARRELAGASKQELIELLNQFLLNTLSIGGSALLIIDEAQNLPLPTLEQIRILSNLETNKEKLLQIILVGQLGLIDVLRSEQLRQLDQRIATRYQVGPLVGPEVGRYIAHRLAIAGAKGSPQFVEGAVQQINSLSKGFPRLINLLCDRALMSGFSIRSHVITKEMIKKAAENLNLQTTSSSYAYKLKGTSFWSRRRRPLVATLAFVIVAILILAFWSQISSALQSPVKSGTSPAQTTQAPSVARADSLSDAPGESASKLPIVRNLPESKPSADESAAPVTKTSPGLSFEVKRFVPDARYPYTLLLGSFQAEEPLKKTMGKLESMGYKTYVTTVDLKEKGIWHRLLVGHFKSVKDANRMADEIKEYRDFPYVKVVTSERVNK